MSDFVSIVIVFSQPVAIAITLVYLFGFFSRSQNSTALRNATMGVLMGIAACIAMKSPIAISDGVIMDLRNLFVGLAAGLFGWVGGIITLLIGAGMRITIGGAGAPSGVVGMVLATGGALLWRHYVRDPRFSQVVGYGLLGAMISLHFLGAFMVPAEVRYKFLIELGPTMVICNIVGTILLGSMIQREEILVNETETLRNYAETDPLTRLMNRRRLKAAFDVLPDPSKSGEGRAMIYFDVDNFKAINDTHGHLVGDAILMAIGERIKSCLRPQDLFARLGGDEFLIVLPDINPSAAQQVSERCRNAVSSHKVQIDDLIVDATISLGVDWTIKAPVFDADLAKADAALYMSKKNGRDRVTFSDRMPQAA